MEIDKKAFYSISYGLYIISTRCDGDKKNAQIANTVFQVTSEPPQIAVALNKQNLTHDYIQKSGYFGVSVLSESAPMEFIGTFGFKSGRDINKFEKCNFKEGNKCPLVTDHTVSILEAKLTNQLDCGTHTIFVGEVIGSEMISNEIPLTYAEYHNRKGKAPKTAPTYQDSLKETKVIEKTEEKPMKKYVCNICGYVYDPAKGDPDGGIAPGTPFEQIPDSWVCPICGAAKSDFTAE